MEYKGFIGETYQARSASVSADRCVNWFPEVVKTGVGKAQINYYPTPGLTDYVTRVPTGPGRGLFALNGRTFAVMGAVFLEFFSDFTSNEIFDGIANDGSPVSFASNGTVTLIASANVGYYFDGAAVSQITGGTEPDGSPGTFFGASVFAFLDGYFIDLTPNSRQIQISPDGINWSAADVSLNLGSADNLVGIITDHEYLYLFGNQRSAVYYDSGNADFPIVPVSGAFIEQGLAARDTLRRADNTLMWLGEDERGGRALYRAQGFVPTPVSTPAVEQAWQQYATVSDAIAFVEHTNGHTNYRITFPSADASWCYDLTTGMWHERASFNIATGTLHAQIQWFHCYARGLHFVTGGTSRRDAKIYTEDQNKYTDNGIPIKRVRVGPVVYNANKRLFISRLEVVIQPGIGLDGDESIQGHDPGMMLRYLSDGSWSNEMRAFAGKLGDSRARIVFDNLGSARAWIPEVSVTDPNNWVLIEAQIDLTAGYR